MSFLWNFSCKRREKKNIIIDDPFTIRKARIFRQATVSPLLLYRKVCLLYKTVHFIFFFLQQLGLLDISRFIISSFSFSHCRWIICALLKRNTALCVLREKRTFFWPDWITTENFSPSNALYVKRAYIYTRRAYITLNHFFRRQVV